MLAQTDSLILGWDKVLTCAKEFKRISVDAVLVEALPGREAIKKCVEELDMPVFAGSKSRLPIDLQFKLTNTSHLGGFETESFCQGPCRAWLLYCTVSLDTGRREAGEHMRDFRSTKEEYDGRCAANDTFLF